MSQTDGSPPLPGSEPPEAADEIHPVTGIRKVVARRMAEAWRTIPAVTLNRTLPMGPLLELRSAYANATGTKLSLDAVLAGCVARALAATPILNGSWLEAEQAVAVHSHRNIAVAVDTPSGLTVVVLRDADAKTPAELTAELIEMVGRARDRRSLPADVADATFTITNLGSLGIDTFSPIITLPQAAVLGIGRIAGPEAEGRPAHVSLTFDHRVADGADAARFLLALVDRIAEVAG